MLRYREELGLLPPLRDVFARPAAGGPGRGGPASSGSGRGGRPHSSSHRQFSEADIAAVAEALELERRYDISPAALAFGVRVLAEPSVRASVADLARRLGRLAPTPSRALDFEKERALRSLSRR
jgi:MerR family copper efflux transcriptional regulator